MITHYMRREGDVFICDICGHTVDWDMQPNSKPEAIVDGDLTVYHKMSDSIIDGFEMGDTDGTS